MNALLAWWTGDQDLGYEPTKLRDIQMRLLNEDAHRWLPVVNPPWRGPVARPRHRRP